MKLITANAVRFAFIWRAEDVAKPVGHTAKTDTWKSKQWRKTHRAQ
jgi:hypothetical protein